MARTAKSENPRLSHLTTKLSRFSPRAVSLDGPNGENDLVPGALNCELARSPELRIVGARFRHFFSDLKPGACEDFERRGDVPVIILAVSLTKCHKRFSVGAFSLRPWRTHVLHFLSVVIGPVPKS